MVVWNLKAAVQSPPTRACHDCERSSSRNGPVFTVYESSYRLFWNQHFTWASAKWSLAASSIRSWTLRYFVRSKLFSKAWSCRSENAARQINFRDELREHISLGITWRSIAWKCSDISEKICIFRKLFRFFSFFSFTSSKNKALFKNR